MNYSSKGMQSRLIVFFTSLIMAAQSSEGYEKLVNPKEPSDFFGISKFIERTSEGVNAFSPLGAFELYSLITRIEEKDTTTIKDIHTEVIEKIMKLDRNKFSVSSGYLETDSKGIASMHSSFSELFLKIYMVSDLDTVFDKYPGWMENLASENPIPLDFKDAEKTLRVFSSYVYFDHELVKFTESKKMKFTYQNNSSVKTKFVGRTGYINHTHISLGNEKHVDIVVLPYKNMSGECTRFLIYLIPKSHDCDLSLLWDDFEKHTKYNLKSIIDKCDSEKISFYAPKIYNFTTKLDLKSILPPQTSMEYSDASMTTFFKWSEVKKPLTTKDVLTFAIAPRESIYADRSHLALVYDTDVSSILIFMKCTGL